MRKGLSYHGRRNTVNNGASLAFNFLNGQGLDPRITFTRASSATFVGSNGLIQSATTNTPRFDYDPVTLAAKGLLIEEQRTNLLTYSEQFDNAAWTKRGTCTVTPNAISAPDGTTSADLISGLGGTGNDLYSTVATVTLNAPDSPSFFINKVSTTGTLRVGNPSDSSKGNWYIDLSLVGSGWQRITLGHPSVTVITSFVGNGGGDGLIFLTQAGGPLSFYLWGAQLEAGSFPTSYIPTVASQVTRAADVASVNTLSPWYNATEGTIYVEADSFVNITTAQVYNSASINDGTSSNRHRMFIYNGNWGAAEVVGGVNQCDLQRFASYTANVPAKSAFGYKINDFALSVNGTAALTDTSGSVATSLSRLSIGGSPTDNFINGHIRRITYYPRRLTNAELQAITA